MISQKRFALAAVMAIGLAPSVVLAQPALTTIQDILYLADGTRFNGTMFIAWNSFQSGGGANIPTSNLTIPIVNGVLRVALVPTTDASAGAQYNITYNSNGVNQFTEVWSVPQHHPAERAERASFERHGRGPATRHEPHPHFRRHRVAE